MLRSAALLTVAALLAPAGLAQTIVATDLANHPFTTDFSSGGKLRLSGLQGGDDLRQSIRAPRGKRIRCRGQRVRCLPGCLGGVLS